jgi:hypothetical protein
MKKFISIISAAVMIFVLCSSLFAIDTVKVQIEKNSAAEKTAGAAGESSAGDAESRADSIKKKSVRWSVLVAAPLNFYLTSVFTWEWGRYTKFRFAREGWFGQYTYTGGSDKAAHFYSFYIVTRASYALFNYTENGGRMKWVYATALPAFAAIETEIGDGFCKKQNGFSASDLAMGYLGIVTAVLLERFPVVDSFLGFSIEYWPTKYFRDNPSKLGLFLDDYSGWKFMGNIKLAGFNNLFRRAPGFLRYISLDVGYYTTGYTVYDNRVEHRFRINKRERNIFIGLSVNMAEAAKDFFQDRESFAAKAVSQPFNYIHFPVGAKHRERL